MSESAPADQANGRHRDPIAVLKAHKRAGRIANYRVSIDDAYGPDHDKTFVATAQVVARSGRTYTARGEHRRHKLAQIHAVNAVLDQVRANEPPHTLAMPMTKRQRRAVLERRKQHG